MGFGRSAAPANRSGERKTYGLPYFAKRVKVPLAVVIRTMSLTRLVQGVELRYVRSVADGRCSGA